MKLLEGDGLAALAEPSPEFPRLASFDFATATSTLGPAQSLIAGPDELSWIKGDVVARLQPMNSPIAPIWEAEEAEILSHPDVAAAVDASLPEIEAWERTL